MKLFKYKKCVVYSFWWMCVWLSRTRLELRWQTAGTSAHVTPTVNHPAEEWYHQLPGSGQTEVRDHLTPALCGHMIIMCYWCMCCLLHQGKGGGHDAVCCDPEDRWETAFFHSHWFTSSQSISHQIDSHSLDLLTQTDKQLEKFNKKFKGLQMFKASSCKSKNSSRKKSSWRRERDCRLGS